MNNPVSTYRLQFHKDFSFDDFEKLIPYFKKLGVGTIYASPILESTPGSTHGYDGVNPAEIDQELGTLEQLKEISAKLKEAGIGWLQDIVPNHMAFHSDNPWLMDVLEKGIQSKYATYFDIAWNNRLFHGKIMVPFLGKSLDEVIEGGDLKLAYANGRLVMDYAGAIFPLNLRSYVTILSAPKDQPQALQQLVSQFQELNEIEDSAAFSQRWDEILLQLSSLVKNEQVKSFVDQALETYNASKDKLKEIADLQAYVLCHWQKTEDQINFRRFFTVNGLICLNMQQDEVFNEYHSLVKKLTDEKVFTGLRIDHIDGLYDPTSYLEKLRALAGEETYIVAEKILEEGEDLPVNWPIEGTTGYEFLGIVNNLLTNPAAEKPFTDYYHSLVKNDKTIYDQLLSKKSEILYGHMGGELENLYQLFVELQLADQKTLKKIGKDDLKEAIGEMLVHCPVYRYYGNEMPLPEAEQQALSSIFEEVRKYHDKLSAAVAVLEKALLSDETDEDYLGRATEFFQRCMQFSGPLMAKGGEDTLMYTNNRFIAHSEVGDFPDRFGMPAKEFHSIMRKRQAEWPLALNATSTHDTKRGEDVRARLNVLTDLGSEWIERAKSWREMNKSLLKGKQGPDANDEYLIYQAMVGSHVMPGQDEDDFAERFHAYLEKALREGKVNSDWASPNETYEQQTKDFVTKLLEPESPFYKDFSGFLSEIADFGVINSLVQLTLKFTCPGIPDTYQGCELWDLSMVDPDNRRAVDYKKRQQWLTEFEDYDRDRLLEKLWDDRYSGGVKLWLTHELMQLRQKNPLIFTKGDYLPLKVRGEYRNHVLAFGRKQKKDFYVVVVPLHIAQLCREQQKDFFELDWKDTSIVLPDNMSEEWENLFTGANEDHQGKLVPGDIFKGLPIAILKGTKPDNERKAGVLLHITSLASPYGIGDLGPEAYAFADFLGRSSQKIWQLLPLNPTEGSQANSPYSALSSRAGNPLLISPDLLAEDGLLDKKELTKAKQKPSAKLNFKKAEDVKAKLLEKAFQKFEQQHDSQDQQELEAFCTKNEEWLPDFALYVVLKKQNGGKPWYEWPDEVRTRSKKALEEIRKNQADLIRFVEWQQYTFDKQWKALHEHCTAQNIQLLGDIPFYVSYDSADVWANKEFFCVDKSGKINGIAGVPPDAFSEDGQLWGMPVFNWDVLKEQGYQWWIQRLAKNIELFDLVRLDHFRAFADYWEVPGGEKTAVNGEWRLGPGEEFFKQMESNLGKLPFIAEDLGEITPDVYRLRDKFKLPGMKVIQFAFDENMPQSDHIPHNYGKNFIAYSGTHDNNTTRGWFKQSAADGLKDRIEAYIGKEVTEETVCSEMARLVYASVAKIAILPIQDVLNLGEDAKMNMPGSSENNWAWRLLPGQIDEQAEQFLSQITKLFNRE